MSVSITIRHVPDDVRARLAEKAARSGRSLQEYLTAELRQLAFRPSPVDFVHALETRVELDVVDVATEDILSARDADRR